MKILVIDTSLDHLGIAIVDGKDVKYENVIDSGRKHSENIMIEINEALKKSNIEVKNLDAITVTNGPGSYTGIRIGVTIAKVLAYLENIPVIPISSLQAYSLYVNDDEDYEYIIPVVDARGNTVYAGIYDYNHRPVEHDQHYTVNDFNKKIDTIKGKPVFIGNGLDLVDVKKYDIIKNIVIKPSLIGFFAQNLSSVDPHTLKPNYLKLIEAEIKFNNEEQDG